MKHKRGIGLQLTPDKLQSIFYDKGKLRYYCLITKTSRELPSIDFIRPSRP